MSPESVITELYIPSNDKDRGRHEYLSVEVRRRGATEDVNSLWQLTPNTPVAELPGHDADIATEELQFNTKFYSRVSKLPDLTNKDGLLAEKLVTDPKLQHPAIALYDRSSWEEMHQLRYGTISLHIKQNVASYCDQHPGYARGLSDTTIQSESTAISQPSPEELERWVRNEEDRGYQRPMSPWDEVWVSDMEGTWLEVQHDQSIPKFHDSLALGMRIDNVFSHRTLSLIKYSFRQMVLGMRNICFQVTHFACNSRHWIRIIAKIIRHCWSQDYYIRTWTIEKGHFRGVLCDMFICSVSCIVGCKLRLPRLFFKMDDACIRFSIAGWISRHHSNLSLKSLI